MALNREIRALTGLRGVAAFDVALLHIGSGQLHAVDWFAFHNAAVDIFFCLSSFTLCLVYGAGETSHLPWRHYAAARFARIYPLYFAIVALFGVIALLFRRIYIAKYGIDLFLLDFFRQIVMVNGLPIIGNGTHWIVVMWSLSIEAFCYVAVFPPLFWLSLRAIRLPVLGKTLIMLLCAAITMAVYLAFFDPAVNSHVVPPAQGPFVHWVAITRGICMFVAGWLAGLAWRGDTGFARMLSRYADLMAAAFFGIMLAQAFGYGDQEELVLMAPFFILAICHPGSRIETLLSGRLLHYLGTISYSLYLIHMPVATVLIGAAEHNHVPGVVSVPITLAVSLWLAHQSYFRFERPARIWLRQRLVRDGSAVPVV